MRLEEIQKALEEQGLDGWLFYDHHQRDPLAYRVLGLTPERAVTRRWYYLIPASGEPRGLVHRIEAGVLEGLPGSRREYASWRELVSGLAELLAGRRRVAMQYSAECALPQVSLADAGTVELVRKLGAEVVSSADLIQMFEARWTQENLACHLEAGRRVDRIRAEAFDRIGEKLRAGATVREYEVKEFIRERFAACGLTSDHGPIVAVNQNASNPHYEPRAGRDREIRPGDVVLIDLWAKLAEREGVYYDVTWMGYCGAAAPAAVEEAFRAVAGARDRALELVREGVSAGRALRGFEVDDAARGYLAARGYGDYFTHRTGHSIGREVHGAGANMDNLETHDERRIIPWTCFSIEPGVYLGEFGVRSEVDVFVGEREAQVTGEIQREIVKIRVG